MRYSEKSSLKEMCASEDKFLILKLIVTVIFDESSQKIGREKSDRFRKYLKMTPNFLLSFNDLMNSISSYFEEGELPQSNHQYRNHCLVFLNCYMEFWRF